jgi:hypothetical protein
MIAFLIRGGGREFSPTKFCYFVDEIGVREIEVHRIITTVIHKTTLTIFMRGFQPFLFGLNAVYYLRKV